MTNSEWICDGWYRSSLDFLIFTANISRAFVFHSLHFPVPAGAGHTLIDENTNSLYNVGSKSVVFFSSVIHFNISIYILPAFLSLLHYSFSVSLFLVLACMVCSDVEFHFSFSWAVFHIHPPSASFLEAIPVSLFSILLCIFLSEPAKHLLEGACC